MDKMQELIEKLLNELENKYFINFSTPELELKGNSEVECSFWLMNGSLDLEKCYNYFDLADTDDYVKTTLYKNLITTLLTTAETKRMTDQDFVEILNSQRKDVDRSTSYELSDAYQNNDSLLIGLEDMAYDLNSQITKKEKLLDKDELTKPSGKVATHIVGVFFRRWCKDAWLHNHSAFGMLDYPERACLSLNTINRFAVDKDLLEDTDHYDQDLMKLQEKVMKALGVKDK